MYRYILAAVFTALIYAPATAQDREAEFSFSDDRFLAGRTVTFEGEGTDDLFMAGEIVRSASDIGGSVHMAGRKTQMSGAVGGDAYLAGMDVVLDGSVTGDATLAGYTVRVGEVGGDLRLSGSDLTVDGPVAGYALIAGEDVRIDGVIAGDAMLNSRDLDFGDDARIDGQLIVFERKGERIEIPESVVPEDRIERRDIADWEEMAPGMESVDWWEVIGKFFIGVIVVAALASLIAAMIPQTLAQLRQGLLARPFRNLFFGFLTQSAIIGSIVVFGMTVIGIALIPASLLVAFVVGFAGYVVAVYSFGVGLLLAFGRPEPEGIGKRAFAAGIGALTAGVIALIPFLGWLFVLALVLGGVGAITLKVLRPGFFVPA